jgi:SAM-dependent methyltransferase
MDRFQNTGQPDWDWWGRLWPTPGETLRRLGIGPGETLAEVGSGNGYFALPAARIVAPSPVYAVDLDESVLDDLQLLAETHGIDNVVTVQGDARTLADTLPETVDTVLVANTFHGVADPDAFVQEISAALRPDGRFIVVNWHDRPRAETTIGDAPRGPPTELRLAPSDTCEIVEATGAFIRARQIELPPYHYALCFDRI